MFEARVCRAGIQTSSGSKTTGRYRNMFEGTTEGSVTQTSPKTYGFTALAEKAANTSGRTLLNLWRLPWYEGRLESPGGCISPRDLSIIFHEVTSSALRS